MSCDGCKDGCSECCPWRCKECYHGNILDQDCDSPELCEPCAEGERKYRAMQKRQDDLEGAADYEYDRRKDDDL